MKPVTYFLNLLLLLCGGFTVTTAQSFVLTTPDISPKSAVFQTIGVTEVSVSYNRPSVKGRKIWGELVPYQAIWRAGANGNTTIQFSENVKIEGKELPAGKYGFHVLPMESKTVLIFSKNADDWGNSNYSENADALRVEIHPAEADKFYEHLTFTFDDLKNNSATCALQWERKKFPFKIETDVHQAVLAKMRSELQAKPGFTWLGWHEAAKYCLTNKVNLEEGLGWASRSVFINPNNFNLITKAELVGEIKEPGDETKKKEATLAALDSDLAAINCTWKEYDAAAKYALKLKNHTRASDWSSKAIAQSSNMTTLMTKVQILEETGKEKEAQKLRQEAIRVATNTELNNYGYQLLYGGKEKESLEIFEANTQRHPADPNVWDSLGEAYYTNNMKDKSVAAFKKSLSLNPPDNVKANTMNFLRLMNVKIEEENRP